MKRFVLVAFNYADGAKDIGPKLEILGPTLTAIGSDWIRYNGLTWILWTSKPLAHISVLLAPHLGERDQVLLSILSGEFFGVVSPWIWDWIHSKNPDWTRLTDQEAIALMNTPEDEMEVPEGE